MSLVASYNVLREDVRTGVWGPGTYSVGDEVKASGEIVSVSLEISSDNASVRVIADGAENAYTLSGSSEKIELSSCPSVLVESGEVSYSYAVKWDLSFPAFLIMIV